MLQPEREHKREPCGQDVSAPRSPPAVLLHGLVRERPSTRHETSLYRNHGLSRRDEDQPSSSPLATHLSHLRGRVDQVPHVTVEFIFPPVSRGIAGSTNHKAVGETVWNRDKVRVSRKRNGGSSTPWLLSHGVFTWVYLGSLLAGNRSLSLLWSSLNSSNVLWTNSASLWPSFSTFTTKAWNQSDVTVELPQPRLALTVNRQQPQQLLGLRPYASLR